MHFATYGRKLWLVKSCRWDRQLDVECLQISAHLVRMGVLRSERCHYVVVSDQSKLVKVLQLEMAELGKKLALSVQE